MKVRDIIILALKPILYISDKNQEERIVKSHLFRLAVFFLADNRMFGIQMSGPWQDPEVDEAGCKLLSEFLGDYLRSMGETTEQKVTFLIDKLRRVAPITADRLAEYYAQNGDKNVALLMDYLAAHEDTELHLMDDSAFSVFANTMHEQASAGAVKALCSFAIWEGTKYGDVSFACGYTVTSRGVRLASQAYSLSMISNLHHLLLDEPVIAASNVYKRACESHAYANAIIYVSIHLVCGLRDTDLERIPRPALPDTPEKVLASISTGEFSDQSALETCEYIMRWLEEHYLKPNKVKRFQMMPDIIFYITPQLRPHFGKLFLICEAHLQIEGKAGDAPLFHKVTDYWTLKRILGDEIADFFKERDLCPTAMSKSFMQGISIEAASSSASRGVAATLLSYQMARMARSHKNQYGVYSATTTIYLRDNAFSGLTADIVAGELFKRGPFSCLRSLFLSLVTDGEYERVAFFQQTLIHKRLGIGPLELEELAGAVLEAKKWAASAWMKAQRLSLRDQKKVFAEALRKERTCAIEALRKECQRPEEDCSCCPYRLDVMALIYHASTEAARLKHLMGNVRTTAEKKKYALLTTRFFAPTTGQLMEAMKEVFGEAAGDKLHSILAKNLGMNSKEDL